MECYVASKVGYIRLPLQRESSPSQLQLDEYPTGNEYSLTYFNEARLNALAIRLGLDRVSHSRAKVTYIIGERMRTIERVPAPAPDCDRIRVFDITTGYVSICVQGNSICLPSLYLSLTM
jgi:hypothetical protein